MTVSQTQFHEALLDASRDVPTGLLDGLGQSAGSRFSVYRNNIAVGLTEALEASFPAIVKLIGDENFKKVAGLFLRQHPPSTPMIMYYGAEFPEFLDGFEPLKKYGYLPDVARLEQAQREAYHAQDANPVDAGILQALTPDELVHTRMEFAPAVRLMRSPWPIHAIWAFNLEDGPKPQPGSQNVLITRPEFDPVLTPIGTGAARFVDALRSGQTLGDANDAAAGEDATFDLSQTLGLLIGNHAITDLHTGDTPS